MSTVIDCKKFSRLDKLLSVTALVLRFNQKLITSGRAAGVVPADISAEDISEAEEIWIKDIKVKLTLDTKFSS